MVRRARPVRDRAIPEAVEQLTRRFEYPETDPGPQGVSILGGGGGAPTIVVAASDASDFSKSKADFICPGVDDHQIIMAALALMDTGFGLGGRLLLTEGSFECRFGQIRTADSTGQSPMTIQGLGQNTILNMNGGTGDAIDINSDGSVIRDLMIQGNDNPNVAGIAMSSAPRRVLIENVYITRLDSGDAGIVLFLGDEVMVRNCRMHDNGTRGIWVNGSTQTQLIGNTITESSGHGIEVGTTSSVQDLVIAGNHIDSDASAIHVVQATNRLVIDANTIIAGGDYGINLDNDDILYVSIVGNTFHRCNDGAIRAEGASNLSIVGNSISQSALFGTDAAILLENPAAGTAQAVVVAENVIDITNDNGIEVSEYADVQIMGNHLRNIDGHGISLFDTSNSKVTDNLIFNIGGDGTNTFDGIILSGDSDGNLIDGNKVVPGPIVVPRYGINISAGTCDDNAVVGNDFSDPGGTLYGTARFNDAGTGTVTTWAGTFGDNID